MNKLNRIEEKVIRQAHELFLNFHKERSYYSVNNC